MTDRSLKRKKVIFRRLSLAFVLYVVFFIIGLYFSNEGVMAMPRAHFLLMYSFIVAAQCVSYWLVKTGYFNQDNDEVFTGIQILVMNLSLIYVMTYLDYTQQAALINVSILGLLFGVFSLGRAYFLFLSSVPIMAFSILIASHYFSGTLSVPLNVAILQLLILSVLLVSCSTIANYLSVLRDNLKLNHQQLGYKKEDLEVAQRELLSVIRQTEKKASRDELTGLFNRRQFGEVLHAQISVALSSKTPLGFLLLDVDHFKPVNDTYGHLAGDKILRAFSKIHEHCLRKTDFIARYGGEEFVVLLPDADESLLLEIGERIRIFVESMIFDDIKKGFHVTVSIGATHYLDQEAPDETIKRADLSLYEAKNTGRNQMIYAANSEKEYFSYKASSKTMIKAG